MTVTKKEVKKALRKLGFKERTGGNHYRFKFVHEGMTVLSTTVPYGRGELHILEHKIRRQITLRRAQFDQAIACPFKAADYLRHLSQIGRV